MTAFLEAAVLLLLTNMAAGLVRVIKGPTPADRMMGAQLIGTGGVSVLVLLALIDRNGAILDVALLLALLAAFAAVAFVMSGHAERRRGGAGEP